MAKRRNVGIGGSHGYKLKPIVIGRKGRGVNWGSMRIKLKPIRVPSVGKLGRGYKMKGYKLPQFRLDY